MEAKYVPRNFSETSIQWQVAATRAVCWKSGFTFFFCSHFGANFPNPLFPRPWFHDLSH